MRKFIAILVSVAAALTVTTAVAPAHAADAPPPTLIVRDLPAQVRLIPGEKVKIVLSTNRTTGYSWHAEGGCCVKGTDKFVAKISAGRFTAPSGDLVGAPGTTTWTVTALRPGKTTVDIMTRPPGVENTMQDESVGVLTVIVHAK